MGTGSGRLRKGHSNTAKFRRLAIEALEPRVLLSGSEAAVQVFGTSPALFVENQGQWAEPSVRYAFHGLGGNIFFTDAGPIFQLFQSTDADPAPDDPLSTAHCPLSTDAVRGTQFSVTFDGANPVAPAGQDKSDSYFNYLLGDPSAWRTNVSAYETVAYEGLYEGIDLLTWGRRDSLKYEFHVAPGADYSQIQISYAGISGLSIADDGSLRIALADGFGEMIDDAPVIYQEIDGQRIEVAGAFLLVDADTYSFQLTGACDPTRELIFDPELVWSSYMGGAGAESARGVAVDSAGSVYVAGETYSGGWVSGGLDTTLNGGSDVFVVKLTVAGAHVWSTYLGGTSDDAAQGLAADSSDDLYVTGWTASSGWTSGGFDTEFGGSSDAFVVKLTSAGAHAWSTYLGGTGADGGYDVAVDGSGGVHVTGYTASDGWAVGGFDTTLNGGESDAFAAKLTSNGTHTWSTYLGGGSRDRGYGIALDQSGNVYVTGETYAGGWANGGFDTIFGGTSDAFVAKLTSSGGHAWSTYLGGGDTEVGYGIAVDASGGVYATGETYSGGWVSGGFDTVFNGGASDGFVAKLTTDGAHAWSTFLGGGDVDRGYDIVVDNSGGIWLTGQTFSGAWVVGGFAPVFHGGTDDAFLMWLSSDGARTWSTFLGGTGSDFGAGIAAGSGESLYVAGWTTSSGWASGGYDTSHGGDLDAFLATINIAWGPPGSWSTYIGGDGSDTGRAMAVDAEGSSYVVGYTGGAGWVSGGYDTTYNGGANDAYLVKVDSQGNHVWSTYIGGSGDEEGLGVAVDAQGNVYVTGMTYSSGWVSGAPFGQTYHNNGDAFVVKISSSSGAHLWSAYLGGNEGDFGSDIAVDSEGNVLVSGATSSAGWVSGGYDTTLGGTGDGFLVKLTGAGAHVWSTYLGGSAGDPAHAIVLDDAGNSYVVGTTGSSGWVSGGYDTTYNGGQYDAYMVKVSALGQHVWSTYVGGSETEYGNGITLDSSGNVYVTGCTNSSGWASGGYDTTYDGPDWDGFVVKLTNAGQHTWSTYFGGSAVADMGYDVAVNPAGEVYVSTTTGSDGWVAGGFDTTRNGDYDAAVLALSSSGNHLWSTYVGGTEFDGAEGHTIATYGTDAVFLMGITNSPGWTWGGYDPIYNGGDTFLAKLALPSRFEYVEWSTYLGGDALDKINGITTDNAGNTYVTGYTDSSGWVSGGFDTSYNGGRDAFVAKFDAAGDLLWSTYLGGSGLETGTGILLDGSGAIYVSGYTGSSGWVSGGFDTSYGGGTEDGFVVKLDSSGVPLWSTYLGGGGEDAAMSMAIGPDGNVVAAGLTESSGWVSGGYDPSANGGFDGFAVKLGSGGEHLWSTYLGGGGIDDGYGVAIDSLGNVLLAGATGSPGWVSGGFNTAYNGGSYDGYVVKLDSQGQHLWSSYLGGGGYDFGYAVAMDAAGSVYLTGATDTATGWVSGGFDTGYNGGTLDAFVLKLSAQGAHVWSTYLGGSGLDDCRSTAIDGEGNVLVSGYTESADWPSGGFDTTYNGGTYDAYVVKLTSDGGHVSSTYLGGSSEDPGQPHGLAVDADGYVYVAGHTDSSGWTYGGRDVTYNGAGDGFLAKISMEVDAPGQAWSTYAGGDATEDGFGAAVDSQGNTYFVGVTYSAGWVSGGYDTTYGGGQDGFVVKVDSQGNHVWSTYLGAGGDDFAYGVAVDGSGNVYVT